MQEAIVTALERWPASGMPANPGAWLQTTARRKAIDRLRRRATEARKLAELAEEPMRPSPVPIDERLALVFTCCHPALSREAQIALTLRAVGGLTTQEIARAFLVSEATIAQRIVRAKRKIVDAHIPLRMPDEHELVDRLGEVLAVLYLLFNEGYLSSGPAGERRDLAEDAEWLGGLLVQLMPDEPEAIGLLALMRLQLARAGARFDARGDLVLLADQDRSRWDRTRIADGIALVERAARMRRPGPYQLQAAIAACHAEARSTAETDWTEILALYDLLVAIEPSPVARLNRAIAVRDVRGAATALAEVDELAPELARYHLFHATRAELLRDLGHREEARLADARALELTENPAERRLLQRRLG